MVLLLIDVGAGNRAAAEAVDLNLDMAVDSITAARIKVRRQHFQVSLLQHACFPLHLILVVSRCCVITAKQNQRPTHSHGFAVCSSRNAVSCAAGIDSTCTLNGCCGVLLQELVVAKEAAVAAEDYDEAKRLKGSIERLKVGHF